MVVSNAIARSAERGDAREEEGDWVNYGCPDICECKMEYFGHPKDGSLCTAGQVFQDAYHQGGAPEVDDEDADWTTVAVYTISRYVDKYETNPDKWRYRITITHDPPTAHTLELCQ